MKQVRSRDEEVRSDSGPSNLPPIIGLASEQVFGTFIGRGPHWGVVST